jgi:hypothetical protein
METVVALAAGYVMKNHDPVAGSEAGNPGANSGNHAGSLVAEDTGSGVRSGGDLFQIGAADATGVDADEQLSGADLRDRYGFQTDVVDSPVNRSQHGRRDWAHLMLKPELIGDCHYLWYALSTDFGLLR